MCGLGTNQFHGFGNSFKLDGADVSRYWFTYESKLDGLAKWLGSDSFTVYCERIETTKERVS